MVDEHALRPVSYTAQRFGSSSYNQRVKIEKSFGCFWKAFDLLYPIRSEDEEWQYMIACSDFFADLLSLLDILGHLVDLMLCVQTLDTPVWKLKLWWLEDKEKLINAANEVEDAFPRLKRCVHNKNMCPKLEAKFYTQTRVDSVSRFWKLIDYTRVSGCKIWLKEIINFFYYR